MTPSVNDQTALRNYLLGRLAPDARERTEERVFSDDQVFWERLCLEEEQLIDDYECGRLDEQARSDFERHFLVTDERRAKLDFVRVLREHVEQQKSESKAPRLWDWLRVPAAVPRWALATAAALFLAVPTVVWQLRGGPAPRAPVDVSVWLTSDLVRGAGELARVRIPAACGLARLRLDAGSADYPAYRATLFNETGAESFSQGQLTAREIEGRPAVTLTVPCETLAAGDYYVQLQGLPPGSDPVSISRHDLRVLRE